jgi:Carboxypeptidase regulatory-like domain
MLKPSFAAVALVAAVSCPGAASAQGTVGTLTGVITDAAGSAVAGAFVQMRNAERRLNFMVITQEQGKYSIDRLPAGKYVVQAIGGEHQSAPSSPVEVAAGKASSIDLSLTVERAPALPPAWPGRPPGERGAEAEAAVGGAGPQLADGEGKAIIEAKCMTCHDAQRIVRSRANEARWQQVLSTMSLYAQGSTLAKPLSGDEAKVLLAYLSRPGKRQAEARSIQPSAAYAPSARGAGLHGGRIRTDQPQGRAARSGCRQ